MLFLDIFSSLIMFIKYGSNESSSDIYIAIQVTVGHLTSFLPWGICQLFWKRKLLKMLNKRLGVTPRG